MANEVTTWSDQDSGYFYTYEIVGPTGKIKNMKVEEKNVYRASEITVNIFLIRSFCLLKIFRFHDFGTRAEGGNEW